MSDQPLPPTQPTSPPSAVPQTPVLATIEDFKKIQLKIGVVVSADIHPQADRLLVLKVDLGGGETRQVVAGIRASYEPSSLVGKQVIVVANLKPAMLRGIESQGMVLAASTDTADRGGTLPAAEGVSRAAGPSTLTLLTTDHPAQVGSPVK